LTGKLDVIVRPPERAIEPLLVSEPGALPVVPGGIMSLQVQLKEPAYAYLVWLDSQEQAVPLYPWNTDALEVRDLAAPPPVRQPAKTVYSPLLGGGWKFGDRAGLETVLLLARRTPLPKDTKLADLIQPLPIAIPSRQDELAIFGLNGGESEVAILHPPPAAGDSQALPPADPLAALLVQLGAHFDLVRCVRFANAGK
jgi:hypothetical protein